MTVLERLKSVPAFKEVPEEQLKWLEERSECLFLKKGENLFEPGTPIDRLLVVLKGHFTIKLQKNNQLQVVAQIHAPTLSGLLPYSRADLAKGYAEANEDAEVVVLAKEHFKDMICDCHHLTTVLVHEMSSRIRQFTKQEQLNDKMVSLGKLSAGLAHELNNPSAAVVRSSKALSKHLKFLPEKFKNVVRIQMSEDKIDSVNEMLFGKVNQGVKQLSMMERSKKEEEIEDWLYDVGVEDPEELIDNLIDYGFEIEDLEKVGADTPREHQIAVISWINQVLSTERLVDEIEDASSRINNLVLSIKSYTHMDQAPEKVKTDIHTGIDNTITMLNHKIKDNKIEVERKYGENLPHPEILPSAINQVWTNILDNAIDAMEESETRSLHHSNRSFRNIYENIYYRHRSWHSGGHKGEDL